jgi:hypothetical protein
MNSVHPDDRKMLGDAINAAIEQKREYGLEFRVVWPDGSVHWQAAKGRAFRDETGHTTRMAGSAWTSMSANMLRNACICKLQLSKPLQCDCDHRFQRHNRVGESCIHHDDWLQQGRGIGQKPSLVEIGENSRKVIMQISGQRFHQARSGEASWSTDGKMELPTPKR